MAKAVRLDKFLADAGKGTRSEVKKFIQKGQVQVNGVPAKKPEMKVDLENDVVVLSGETVGAAPEFVYYLLNKPAGCVSATEDRNDRTVMEYVPSDRKGLFPVGRLDKDTEGLLIITNDGDMAHRLLSPKHHIDKTYYVVAKGSIDNKYIDEFKNGLVVDKDFTAMPAKLEILQYNNQDDTTFLNITIQEGKFHQIKRMFKAAGSDVLYLKRLSMGKLQLDETLEPGKFRPLTGSEIDLLKSWN